MILFNLIFSQCIVQLYGCIIYDAYLSPGGSYLKNITQLGRAVGENCSELFERAIGIILLIFIKDKDLKFPVLKGYMYDFFGSFKKATKSYEFKFL